MRSPFVLAVVTNIVGAGCSFNGVGAGEGADAGASNPDSSVADAAVSSCRGAPGYIAIGDGDTLYRFLEEGEFGFASDTCRADGARLATVRSQDHLALLVSELLRQNLFTSDCFLNGPDTPCALVGARQLDSANAIDEGWRWPGGLSLASDDPIWRPNQPDDDGSAEDTTENCAVATSQAPPGLDDRPCMGYSYPAICECR